jgi:hypothetical protein
MLVVAALRRRDRSRSAQAPGLFFFVESVKELKRDPAHDVPTEIVTEVATMSLFIACVLIYNFKMVAWWYVVAAIIWIARLSYLDLKWTRAMAVLDELLPRRL